MFFDNRADGRLHPRPATGRKHALFALKQPGDNPRFQIAENRLTMNAENIRNTASGGRRDFIVRIHKRPAKRIRQPAADA